MAMAARDPALAMVSSNWLTRSSTTFESSSNSCHARSGSFVAQPSELRVLPSGTHSHVNGHVVNVPAGSLHQVARPKIGASHPIPPTNELDRTVPALHRLGGLYGVGNRLVLGERRITVRCLVADLPYIDVQRLRRPVVLAFAVIRVIGVTDQSAASWASPERSASRMVRQRASPSLRKLTQ